MGGFKILIEGGVEKCIKLYSDLNSNKGGKTKCLNWCGTLCTGVNDDVESKKEN